MKIKTFEEALQIYLSELQYLYHSLVQSIIQDGNIQDSINESNIHFQNMQEVVDRIYDLKAAKLTVEQVWDMRNNAP